MINIVYEEAVAPVPEIPAVPPKAGVPGKPKVPAQPGIPGWTGNSPQGLNLDSKMSKTEHTRIITAAIAAIKATAYPEDQLKGSASKLRLGELKKACDDDAGTLKVTKGLHQRHSAHITAQLVGNGITYHLNVMADSVTGKPPTINDRFHWKVVSVSANVDAVAELAVVEDRVGLFHPGMRRNSISLATYQEELRQQALAAENARKQRLAAALIALIGTKLKCTKGATPKFQEKLLGGVEVPFIQNADRKSIGCTYNAALNTVAARLPNGTTQTIAGPVDAG